MIKSLRRPKNEYKALFALMIPIILQNIATNALGLFDTLMVGAIKPDGQIALAGLSQANTVFFVLQLFTFGIMSGGSVLLGQYWGKKDTRAMNRVMGMSFYLAFGISMIAATAIFLFPEHIMGLTTNNKDILDCAVRYGKIVAYSFVLNSVSMVYISAQRNAENSSLGMFVLMGSMVINVFLNWVLIFGKFNAPAMGLEGAAYATVISRIFEIVVVLIYAFFIDKKIPIVLKEFLVPGKLIAKDYIKYATPVVINETLWSTGFSMYAVVFGHMQGAGDILAAYSVAGSIERLMLVLCNGVGTAAAVIISKNIGEGKSKQEVEATGKWLLNLSLVTGVITALFPIAIDRFLLESVVFELFDVTGAAKSIMHMMMLVMAVKVIVKTYDYMSIVGILRGAGNVRVAAIIDIIFMYLWSVPGSFISAFVFGAPVLIVHLFSLSEEILKGIASGILIHRGDWIVSVTRDEL